MPKTKVMLEEIKQYASKLVWRTAGDHLERVYNAAQLYYQRPDELVEALKFYKDYLVASRGMLFAKANELYHERAGNKKPGLLKNTKYWIKLRLQKPLNATEELLVDLAGLRYVGFPPQMVQEEVAKIIRLSDTVLYFNEC